MKNYDPKRIIVTFKGIVLSGYMDGTFLTVERNEDSFEKASGADGAITRIKKNDRSGMVTLTLQQASPSNDVLSASILTDEQTGLGYGPLQVTDLNGTTLCASAEAWVRKPANVEFSDGNSGREWTLECAQLDMLVGGALI